MPQETFSQNEIRCAIEQWLALGKELTQRYRNGEIPMPCAYYDGDGWAARCLRYHLEQLKGSSCDS